VYLSDKNTAWPEDPNARAGDIVIIKKSKPAKTGR
jgi:hypothetical protein